MIQTPPAGQHTVRRHNSALVLGAIAGAPGVSRAGVATRTGLTKATVSSLVDRMISASLVAEGEPERRDGPGRRGTALSLSPAGPHGLGIEVGVDYLASCLVDLTGTVRDRRLEPAANNARAAGRVLGKVARFARSALRRAENQGLQVGGAALAVPALVESATGRVRLAPNLGWHDIDLRAELAGRSALDGLDVLVGNEANFAALAELWHGGHHDLSDFVHVSGEIGIGAGIVLDGALFEGVHGLGGEIGHLPVNPRGPACRCGGLGCLERMAGQEEILHRAGVEDIGTLVDRLGDGDRPALAATRGAARWLGIALSTVVNLLDVPAVVLGGSYARLEPWLRGPLERELNRRVVSARWSAVRVLRSELGTEAAVRGAAGSAVRAIIADPESFITARTA